MRKLHQKRIREIIEDWEKEFPVNEWQIEGVDIWPLLRIKLYIFLVNLDGETGFKNFPTKPVLIEKNFLKKAIMVVCRVIRAKLILHSFFRNLGTKKILFFGSHFHRTIRNGISFNRFFDPMVDAHHLQNEVYMVEYGKVYNKNFNQQAILPLHLYLDHFKIIQRLANLWLSKDTHFIQLNQYKEFHEQLIQQFPESEKLHISIDSLIQWAKKIDRTKRFFIQFYTRTKPEKIIFLSYYGYDDLTAAILAAHKLGIKTIDFQHGPQTNVHMAYSSWTKHPAKPYNTMPVEYWNWDKTSKENIDKWATNLKLIRARLVGHPYLAYCLRNVNWDIRKKVVFFSLQTFDLEEMLPVPILELIKGSNDIWLLRMHPRSKINKGDIEEYLKNHGIGNKNYTVDNAVEKPLPESLSIAKVHITNYSGCVLESLMMNVPSIIIHESGKELYTSYIDDELVTFLNPLEPKFKEKFDKFVRNSRPSNIEHDLKIIHPMTD